MVFLIDVPRIEHPADRASNTLTAFGEELSYFLEAQGVEQSMIRSLQNYDFAETSRYGFVHTMAGYHLDPSVWQRTGYCGLGRTIKALGLDSVDDVDLDYVCSSLGNLKRDLLAALYGACKGDSGLREYTARTGKSGKTKAAASSEGDHPNLSKIRVYYPSRDTVHRSRGGTNVSCNLSSLLGEDVKAIYADVRRSLPVQFACSRSTGIRVRSHGRSCGTARMCAQACCCIAR